MFVANYEDNSLGVALNTWVSTKTAVNTSGSPSNVGQPVTFTATVSWKEAKVTDGGMVTFYAGEAVLASVPLSGGVATYTTAALPAKANLIRAGYAGDIHFKASTGSTTQVVEKYSTVTSLVSSGSPSIYRQPVTFTATVTPSGPYVPTGQVALWEGSTRIGQASLNGGVAMVVKPSLARGTHSITAQYLGDAYSNKSTSGPVIQVVQ